MDERYGIAFQAWSRIIPADRIFDRSSAEKRYGASIHPKRVKILGALQAVSTEEVSSIVKIAQKTEMPLHAISTGHNWGYGTAKPVVDGCVIIDLSRMNKILDLDEEMGVVTLQPGVTQQILRDFLDSNHADFLVPVHGGGPDCSLMGNALERGYGITPYADHFGAVTAIEAVLPTGEIYKPALTELGGTEADKLFKWGIGPYLNGIFAQSNYGIVTSMTIVLFKRPERIEGFYFWLKDDSSLEEAVVAIRELCRTLGSTLGGIDLVDSRRLISLATPYPFDRVAPGKAMSGELVKELSRKTLTPDWMIIGAIYGKKEMAKAAGKIVKKALKPSCTRNLFVSSSMAKSLVKWTSALPFLRNGKFFIKAQNIYEGSKVLEGIPTRLPHESPRWRINRKFDASLPPDPTRDGCGLLWYAPLVPMKPQSVRTYVNMVREVMLRHGLEPLITLVSLSDRLFDSPTPLLYDALEPAQVEAAVRCFDELFERGKNEGFFPYRIGVEYMDLITNPQSVFWQLASTIKRAVDPAGILSPGRYCLLDSK